MKKFPVEFNPHYDFQDEENKRTIADVDGYDLSSDADDYQSGQLVQSPWGANEVIESHKEGDDDVCIKRITVKPGYMLSLQRHRGRSEQWDVVEGVLTVILNGKRLDVEAGNGISLPRESVHCMINSSDRDVVVKETQKGICREKDNIRLIDFNNRPTYPLTTETEFQSAKLYAQIQAEHAKRYGFENMPHASLLEVDGR